MPDPMYVLTNAANSSSVGATINGCKVKVTSTAFELYLPNASSYVQQVEGTQLPVTFEDISITKGNVTTTWDITVDTLPSATDAGNWVTPSAFHMSPKDTNTSGEFTAQAGGAVEPEEAAASAGYGKQ